MPESKALDEMCQILVLALEAMKKANELPLYMASKARDVNAIRIQSNLERVITDESILSKFKNASPRSKVCALENLKTKAELLTLIEEYKPYLDRVKSGSYKLILERFTAAHEFAVELSKIVDTLCENERVQEKSLS